MNQTFKNQHTVPFVDYSLAELFFYQVYVIQPALFGLPVVATEQKDADNIKSNHRQTNGEIGIN